MHTSRSWTSFGAGDFSIDAWIKAQPNGDTRIVEKWNADLSIPGYSFYLFTGGQLWFTWSRSGGVSSAFGGPNLTDNQWHHVAVTIQRGNAQGGKLYVDGFPVQTFDLKSGTVSNTVDLWIGRSRTNSLPFKGVIDEVELFNRALDSTEVYAIWAADSLGKCKPPPDTLCTICGTKFNDLNGDGVQDLSEDGIPGWTINLSGLMTGSTSTDSLGNYCFNNLPPGTYTITEEQRSGWTSTTPVSVTVTLVAGQTVTVNFGNQLANCVSPPDSMVAWWTLDETSGGTTADDIAGFVNNQGIYFGNPLQVPGKVDGGLSFNGTTDYVEVASQTELNFGIGDFSIDAWVKTNITTGTKTIADKRTGTNDDPLGYSLYLWNGNLGLQLADNSGYNNYNTSAFVANGQWNHIAVTVDRDKTDGLRFYLNGVPVNTPQNPTPYNGSLDNTGVFRIASHSYDLDPGFMFKGIVDELELFNRVLDSTEVYAIWAADSLGKCKPPPDSLGTINGMKFNDLNGDGVQDNEPGIPGWTINLSGPVTASATTNSSGNYSFINLPAGPYTVTEEQQSGWTPTTPASQTVTLVAGQTVTVNFGNQLANCVSPPDSMVAWWTLDEISGTIADDIAGFVNNQGIYFGNPLQVPGKVDGGLSFNGTTDYVEVASQTELNFGIGDFSIDAWVKTNITTGTKTIADKRTGTNTNPLGYSLYLWNGNLGLQLADNSGYNNYNTSAFVADGQWNHIAVTVDRDKTDGLRFYLNGVPVNTPQDPTPYNRSLDNTGVFRIASHSYDSLSSWMFNGIVDELELFNRVLDSTEVYAIWAADSLGKCKPPPDTLGTIGGIKFNDLDGDGVRNGSPLEPVIANWEIKLENGITRITTTDASGNYSFTNLTAGQYTISEVIPLGGGWLQTDPPYPWVYNVTLSPGQHITNLDFGNQECGKNCATPPDSMVAWWDGDVVSGTTVFDIQGTYNGTMMGGTIIEPGGKVGAAFRFNGAGDYIQVDDPVVNTPPFSVDAWVNPNSIPPDSLIYRNFIVANGGETTLGIGFALVMLHRQWRFYIRDSGNEGFVGFNIIKISDPGWTHLAGTWDGTTNSGSIKLYVNGILRATGTPSPGSTGTAKNLRIGAPSISPRYKWDGLIDEVEIFNRVLTDKEVSKIFLADSLGKCKLPVSVDEDQTSQVPQQFLLAQNYPNPFNPSTTINYDLPEQSFVSITVYDILGRKVKTLVSGIQDAGYKTVTWNATNEYGNSVSTGIYIYRMQAGAFVQIQKMVFLK